MKMIALRVYKTDWIVFLIYCLCISACSRIEQHPINQYPSSGFRIDYGIIYDKTGDIATIRLENSQKLQRTFSEEFEIGDRLKVFYLHNKISAVEIIDITPPVRKLDTAEAVVDDAPEEFSVEKVPVQKNEPASQSMKTTDIKTLWKSPRKTRFLIVGVGDFKDSSIIRVEHAQADARHFTSIVKSMGVPGKNITCITNHVASRSDITDAIVKLKMATTENSETAVFYFSGHGAPIFSGGEIVDSVLVPYDGMESSLEYTGIKVSMLQEMLAETMGNWIVIFDACFSGKGGRSLMALNVKNIAVVPKDFNIIPASDSKTWWVSSTSGDNFANEFPKKNHGLFTWYFLRALKGETGMDANEDSLISLKEAFDWAKGEVVAVSAKSLGRLQVPELIGRGDVVLTVYR
jgi:hypothetical protein